MDCKIIFTFILGLIILLYVCQEKVVAGLNLLNVDLGLDLLNTATVEFEEGKRYIYNYSAQATTGTADQVQQFSGFGVNGQVIVQKQGKQLIVKLHELVISSNNKRSVNNQSATNSNPLEEPVIVEFKEGLFNSIQIPHSDDIPTRNIKKAIVSLFQLDMSREGLQLLQFKTNKEKGIGGDCVTDYNFKRYQNKLDKFINVTKFWRYDQCDYRSRFFFSSLQKCKCLDCKQENFFPIKTDAQTEYNLKGIKNNYVIQHILSTGSISLPPVNDKGQRLQSVTKQTLDLATVVAAEPIDIPTELDKYDDLYYEFQEDQSNNENNELRNSINYNLSYNTESNDLIRKAEALLCEMEHDHEKDESNFTNIYTPKLIDILSMFDYEDFEIFFGRHILVQYPNRAQILYLETLPLIGTNSSIFYAMEKIKCGEIDNDHAITIINKISVYVKTPSTSLVEAVKILGENNRVKETPQLLIPLQLGYGALLYKICGINYTDECSAYIQELIQNYNSTNDNEAKNLYLKSIGNTRTKDSLKLLIKVVQSNTDYFLTLYAIKNLDCALHDDQLQTQATTALVSMYTNITEDYVLRIHAFKVVLFNNPTFQLFQNLISILEKDTSKTFKNNIYACLLDLTESTDPLFQVFKPLAKSVLNYIEKFLQDDTTNLLTTKVRRQVKFEVLPNDDSDYPREISVTRNIKLFGSIFVLLKIGYTSNGVMANDDNLETSARALEPKKFRSVMNNNVPENNSITYETYMEVMNQYVSFTRQSGNLSKSDLLGVKDESGKIVLGLNTVNSVAIKHIIPNELGLPVTVSTTIPLNFNDNSTFYYNDKRVIDRNPISNTTSNSDLNVVSQINVNGVAYGKLNEVITTEITNNVPITDYLEYIV